MWELTTIAVAFLVVSVGVTALARSTTARWERERAAARARRRAGVAPRTGAPGRLGRARAGAARGMRSARRMGTALGHTVAGHAPRTGAAGPPAGDGELSQVVLPAPQPTPRARPRRRLLRGGLTRHGPGSGIPRRGRRLAARIVHRAGTEQTSPVTDEHRGPAA
jgi:hypothetical protein